MKHERWMQAAIELAAQNKEHPFAAVIVDDNEQVVLGTGVNDSASHPLLHGEIAVLQSCSGDVLRSDNPKTLYSTAEPCPMCIGAIIWSGIQTVCFGTSIETLMKLGWQQIDLSAECVVQKSPRELVVIEGLLEKECNRLFEEAAERR